MKRVVSASWVSSHDIWSLCINKVEMRYALMKFRSGWLGIIVFSIITDHASLRTAVKRPHISRRKPQWLSFFAEPNLYCCKRPVLLTHRTYCDTWCGMSHRAKTDEDDVDMFMSFNDLGINAMISSQMMNPSMRKLLMIFATLLRVQSRI